MVSNPTDAGRVAAPKALEQQPKLSGIVLVTVSIVRRPRNILRGCDQTIGTLVS
jgi:hypothetical protein